MYAVCACVNVSVFVEAGWAGAAEICLHALSRNDAKVLGSSNLSIKLLVNINILYIYIDVIQRIMYGNLIKKWCSYIVMYIDCDDPAIQAKAESG